MTRIGRTDIKDILCHRHGLRLPRARIAAAVNSRHRRRAGSLTDEESRGRFPASLRHVVPDNFARRSIERQYALL